MINKLKVFLSRWGSNILSLLTGAILTLLITNYSDNENREINLKPYIRADMSANRTIPNNSQFGIVFTNLGKGPAIIQKTILYINNERYSFEKDNYKETITTIIDQLKLEHCKAYITADFSPLQKSAIYENAILNFFTIPERTSDLPVINEKDTYREIKYKYNFNDEQTQKQVEDILYLYNHQYQQCRESFINAFSDSKNKISIEVHYNSLNEQRIYGENERIPINTVKPLIP